jgi:hypothetical protein
MAKSLLVNTPFTKEGVIRADMECLVESPLGKRLAHGSHRASKGFSLGQSARRRVGLRAPETLACAHRGIRRGFDRGMNAYDKLPGPPARTLKLGKPG